MDFSKEAGYFYVTINSTMSTSFEDTDLMNDRNTEIERLHLIASNIRNCYIWAVFALGFPGNIFSIITVRTMQTMTPTTFFISFLALCDNCALTVKLIGHQMNVHHVYFGHIGCKLQFFPIFLTMQANWVLVMICAERFVSICLPLKRSHIFTKRRSYICAGALTLILLVSIGSLYGIMRGSDPSGLHCGTYDDYLSFWIHGWYWINITLNLFLPFASIVVLTALIIRGLVISRKQRRSMLLSGREKHEANIRLVRETERIERTITAMLILSAAVFLLLSLPSCVFILVVPQNSDPLTMAKYGVFDQVQYLLIDSTHAVNFFLYFFSLKRFRTQFFSILTCKVRTRNRRLSRHNETTVTIRYTLTKSDENISQL